MGAVCPAQPLDRPVRAPSRLEQEMYPARLVLNVETGMVTASRATGIREDQQALGAVHEGLGFNKVGTGGAGFEPLATVGRPHQPL